MFSKWDGPLLQNSTHTYTEVLATSTTCNCLLPIVFNLLPFVATLIDKNLKFIMGLKPIKNRITVVSIFSCAFQSNQHFKGQLIL